MKNDNINQRIYIRSDFVILPNQKEPKAARLLLNLSTGLIEEIIRENISPTYKTYEIDPNIPLEDFEDAIISPGVIDLNVHFQESNRSDWEGFESGTKAAAAGGVTLALDQPYMAAPNCTSPEHIIQKIFLAQDKLYIDIGFAGAIMDSTLHNISQLVESKIMAFVAYFNKPSFILNQISTEMLKEALIVIGKLTGRKIPLILHHEKALPRLLYMRSPFLEHEIEKRLQYLAPMNNAMFAAAYPEDIRSDIYHSSSSSSSEYETSEEANSSSRESSDGDSDSEEEDSSFEKIPEVDGDDSPRAANIIEIAKSKSRHASKRNSSQSYSSHNSSPKTKKSKKSLTDLFSPEKSVSPDRDRDAFFSNESSGKIEEVEASEEAEPQNIETENKLPISKYRQSMHVTSTQNSPNRKNRFKSKTKNIKRLSVDFGKQRRASFREIQRLKDHDLSHLIKAEYLTYEYKENLAIKREIEQRKSKEGVEGNVEDGVDEMDSKNINIFSPTNPLLNKSDSERSIPVPKLGKMKSGSDLPTLKYIEKLENHPSGENVGSLSHKNFLAPHLKPIVNRENSFPDLQLIKEVSNDASPEHHGKSPKLQFQKLSKFKKLLLNSEKEKKHSPKSSSEKVTESPSSSESPKEKSPITQTEEEKISPLRAFKLKLQTTSTSAKINLMQPIECSKENEESRPAELVLPKHLTLQIPGQKQIGNKEFLVRYKIYMAHSPASWEENGIKTLIELLEELPKASQIPNIHIGGISSGIVMELLKVNLLEGVPNCKISVETGMHNLQFTEEDIGDGETKFKCRPPIREIINQELLLQSLADNQFNNISSQHLPIHPDYKMREFNRALPGLNTIGFTLQSLWTLFMRKKQYFQDHWNIENSQETEKLFMMKMSECLSSGPANILGIQQRVGTISKGKLANLVIWKPAMNHQVTDVEIYSKFTETAIYKDKFLYCKVICTFLRGRKIFHNGKFMQKIGRVFE